MGSPGPVIPILIAGFGRSGTTALMSLLGTDQRVAFGRRYPFEERWLTYLLKVAAVSGRSHAEIFSPEQLADFDSDLIGPPPWLASAGSPLPAPNEHWRGDLLSGFFQWLGQQYPGGTHYAEKAPSWLADALRPMIPLRVVHLVRDPRDAFLSARDFIQARKTAGFGIDPKRSEGEQAREVTRRLLAFIESERSDRERTDAIAIRYEDWVEKPGEVALRLSEFLNLDLKPESSEVTAHLESHRTSASPKASVGRWRHERLPSTVQTIMVPQLLDHFDHHGYERPKDVLPPTQWLPQPEWRHSPDGQWQLIGDECRVTVNAGDAWIELPTVPFRASRVAEIWLCLRGNTGDHNSVYWRGPDEQFSQSRSLHVPFHPGPHWQVVRVPVRKQVKWRGNIEQLRVDVFNGVVQAGNCGAIRWIRAVN